jgi:hypothetical protein
MRFPGHGPSFGFFSVISDVAEGLFFIIVFAVVVGLLVLLVRFLLVATKAAEIYVAKNRAAGETAVSSAAPVAAPTTVDTSPMTPLSETAAAPRKRTPKVPPPSV